MKLAAILLGAAVLTVAQPWSGIIAPTRAIDWSTAGAGPVPTDWTQCGTTIAAGATAATINAALQACNPTGALPGKYVQLAAGNFNFTVTNTASPYIGSGIDFTGLKNVGIRGAGSNQTLLSWALNTGSSCLYGEAAICIYNGSGIHNTASQIDPANLGTGSGTHQAAWVGGYARGSTTIALNQMGSTHPAVGDVIVLDQLDDAYTNRANSDAFICQIYPYCSQDSSYAGGGRGVPGTSGRMEQQFVKVTSITASSTGVCSGFSGCYAVGISPGIYASNWRSGQQPGAWWYGTPITGIWVEGLSLDFSADTESGLYGGIDIINADKVWIRNVRAMKPMRADVRIIQASHVTTRDSYFFGTQGTGSQAYGIEMFMGGDNLVENNIFQRVVAPNMIDGSQGNVFAYNYAINDISDNPAWLQGSQYLHASGTEYDLIEGNDGPGVIADQIHGSHNLATIFRNRYSGFESAHTMQTIPVHIYTQNRYFNVIGNVLGTSSYHTVYQRRYNLDPAGGDTAIFTLGHCGNEGYDTTGYSCPTGMLPDAYTVSSLFRWGNWDTVNGSTQFNSAEVPSADANATYQNPVPGSQTIPASFYLSGKPAWWNMVGQPTPPYPPIGPDVTGGNLTDLNGGTLGGHANKIPARVCFESIMGGTYGDANAKAFNADLCYTTASMPAGGTSVSGAVSYSGVRQ